MRSDPISYDPNRMEVKAYHRVRRLPAPTCSYACSSIHTTLDFIVIDSVLCFYCTLFNIISLVPNWILSSGSSFS